MFLNYLSQSLFHSKTSCILPLRRMTSSSSVQRCFLLTWSKEVLFLSVSKMMQNLRGRFSPNSVEGWILDEGRSHKFKSISGPAVIHWNIGRSRVFVGKPQWLSKEERRSPISSSDIPAAHHHSATCTWLVGWFNRQVFVLQLFRWTFENRRESQSMSDVYNCRGSCKCVCVAAVISNLLIDVGMCDVLFLTSTGGSTFTHLRDLQQQ